MSTIRANSRAHPASQCLGKIAYASAVAAHTALRRANRRSNGRASRPKTAEVYRCPLCHQWHLGNDRLARQQRRRSAS